MTTSKEVESSELDKRLIEALQSTQNGGAKPPKRATLNKEELTQHLNAMSRGPFQQALVDIMGCQPTVEAIRQFADKSPDRWGQLVAIMAKLAGYHDKLEIEANLTMNINSMSDAQLMDTLAETLPLMKQEDGTFSVEDEPPNPDQIDLFD